MDEAAGTRELLLDVNDVHAYYGQSHVLQGVSFQVREGGVTALLGRNGAGKTTTLRGIVGLTHVQGAVVLAGTDLTRLPTHRIVQLGIGYVPEDREIFAGLTVAENLRLAERNGSARYDLVHDLFPILRERAGQRAGTLSGGEQQMVAIGRALLNENRILLIDEPTKGLAPLVVSEMAAVLERMSETETILLVEQNLAVVRRLARDAIVLDQGRVVHAGRVDELLDDEALVRRFLGVSGAESEDRGQA